jgi:hypothetical protein
MYDLQPLLAPVGSHILIVMRFASAKRSNESPKTGRVNVGFGFHAWSSKFKAKEL